jgi:hypothetical protein
MDLVKSTGALKNYRLSAGVSVVAPFIDRLTSIARQNGVELNECSLSVTNVALDIAGPAPALSLPCPGLAFLCSS